MQNNVATIQTTNSKQPRIVFINYANDQYKYQQKFALKAAIKLGGFTEAIPYSPESIDYDFRKSHSELLSIQRGNGLWIWKPYIILDALKNSCEGDYIFYCDSGAFFIDSVMPIIESMGDSDIWVSNSPFVEEQWTKPIVFERLGITDTKIKSSAQFVPGFILVRKSKISCEFISEWLNLCTQPELIKPLEPGEFHGECIAHKEDQSLLSVLCKMRGVKPHKSPILEPKYPRMLLFLNNIINKLNGRETSSLPNWVGAKRVEAQCYDSYEPCIYLYHIRTARNTFELKLKIIMGMGLKKYAKIFIMPRKK